MFLEARQLASLNIEIVSVPANMTHFFQPLDLTVNGQAKKFCKEKFTTWYSQEVQRQLDSGTSFEDIEVDLRMSVIKPLKEGDLSSRDGRKRESKKSLTATNHYHLLIHLKKSTRLDQCC